MQTLTVNPIKDFGRKIGGAKKDLARSAMEQINLITGDALATQPLSKTFPRPDFARMFRDGLIDAETAIRLQFLYGSIPAKPRSSAYRIKRWVERTMPIIHKKSNYWRITATLGILLPMTKTTIRLSAKIILNKIRWNFGTISKGMNYHHQSVENLFKGQKNGNKENKNCN